jgi:hypothetical protein
MPDGSMNLTVPRSEKSVWDSPGFTASLADYDRERWFAAAWGSAVTLFGARRGGVSGGLIAAAGMALAIRAAMGRHDFRLARGWIDGSLRDLGYAGLRGGREDIVDHAAEESFPASDSPSWTANTGATIER